jgi:hypothetical protein
MHELAAIDPDVLEPFLLSHAQMSCPVAHYFGPGVYVREVTIPAGAYAMGNRQKSEHLNIIIKGKVAMIDDRGVNVVSGPHIYTGKPGRKVGYVLEDCVWWNIYPNPDNCRDIEVLEARWTERSPIADEYIGYYESAMAKQYDHDRDDYAGLIASIGMSDEQVKAESENDSDMVDMPPEYLTILSIRKSHISGKGLFISAPVKAGARIAPARIGQSRTIAGRYVNHAKTPNCKYVTDGDCIWLEATKDIDGCIGGSHGEELTVNYLEALKVAGRIEK